MGSKDGSVAGFGKDQAPEVPDPGLSNPGGEGLVRALFALLILAVCLIRWRLLDVPLERDEGEYAYIGQLLLRGEPPYGAAYNMKLPGIYAVYAAILAVFGETHRGIHQGLLCANLISMFFVFLLGRRMFGAWSGLAAAVVFAALSISEGLQGPFANAEHFVLVPATAGLWLFVRYLDESAEEGKSSTLTSSLMLVGSALLLGTAFIIKQHGIAFPAAAGFLLLASQVARRPGFGAALRRLLLFSVCAALPYGLVCLWMKAAGVFENFWFWTFTYARDYTAERPWSDFARNLRAKSRYVMRVAPFLYALSALGLTALLWDARGRRRAGLFLALVVFSFLAVTPGFHFRPHYFVLMLPVVALSGGLLTAALGRAFVGSTRGPMLGLVAALPLVFAVGDYLWRQRVFLFRLSPSMVARQTFGGNPFPESLAVANFVREQTEPDDKVAILGSEPQIWFYADRRAATGYVYAYALMEQHSGARAMHLDMIRQLEEAKAEILVFVRVGTSWLMTEKSPTDLQQWTQRELPKYELVALMPVGIGARLLRGAMLEKLGPDRPKEDVIEIYRRRP